MLESQTRVMGILLEEPVCLAALLLDLIWKRSEQLTEAFGCMRLHKVSGSKTSLLPARCSANASLAIC